MRVINPRKHRQREREYRFGVAVVIHRGRNLSAKTEKGESFWYIKNRGLKLETIEWGVYWWKLRYIPVEVVAEERERRIVEKGGIGLALLDELLQLVQFCRLHFSLTLCDCVRERERESKRGSYNREGLGIDSIRIRIWRVSFVSLLFFRFSFSFLCKRKSGSKTYK